MYKRYWLSFFKNGLADFAGDNSSLKFIIKFRKKNNVFLTSFYATLIFEVFKLCRMKIKSPDQSSHGLRTPRGRRKNEKTGLKSCS